MAWTIGTLVRVRGNDRLGPGRLIATTRDDKAEVKFFGPESLRQSISLEFLERYPLYIGQRMAIEHENVSLVVGEVEDLGDGALRTCLFTKDGGVHLRVPEADLVPASPERADPVSYLECFQWDRPHHFYARWHLMQTASQWYEATEGLPTLLGARIRPLGHQIYAARRVLSDRVPRFVLADEVGLGKTIEAGLVIQALLSADPNRRILVIAPGSMSRQWLCELYLRFGARAFVHLAGGQLDAASRQERIRLLGAHRLIVSSTALLESEALRATIAERHWGLVVVDEAHQMPPGHLLYDFLHKLSRQAEGILALSATPSKRETRGLVGLLSLVAPEAYSPSDPGAITRRLEERRAIWGVLSATIDIVEAARAEDDKARSDALEFIIADWQGVLDGEPEVERLLSRARLGDFHALDELVAYVQEHYRIDHRIIRTRRSTLNRLGTAFARREFEYLQYEPSAPERLLAEAFDHLPVPSVNSLAQFALRIIYARSLSTTPQHLLNMLERRCGALRRKRVGDPDVIAKALFSDPGPAEEERLLAQILETTVAIEGEEDWLERARGLAREWIATDEVICARHRKVRKVIETMLKQHQDAKALVFAQDRAVIDTFAAAMAQVFPHGGVAAFHHGLGDADLEMVALRFQRDARLRILVLDELGGEGRNFENAEWVVHLDSPLAVSRVEQRIGRLDRIGRSPDRPIRSLVVRGPSRTERFIQDVHEHVFEVWTGSVGGLEFTLPSLQSELYRGLGRGDDLEPLQERLRAEVQSTRHDIDEEFERSLDSTRQDLERAQELAEDLDNPAVDRPERAVRHWLSTLGIRHHGDHDCIRFHWDADSLDEPLPGYSPGTGVSLQGTFERQLALEDESLQFYGPGHRLVDAGFAALEVSPRGRATVLMRRLGEVYRGQFFLFTIAQTRPDSTGWSDQPLPAGLQTRAHRFLWPEALKCCVHLNLDEPSRPEIIRNYALAEDLGRPYRRDVGDQPMNVDDLVALGILPRLWAAIRRGIAMAEAALAEDRSAMNLEAAEDLAEDLRAEMGYYHGVMQRGSEPEQVHAGYELWLREELLRSVQQARGEVFGVALVMGG